MELEIHKNASENFNKKAKQLADKLEFREITRTTSKQDQKFPRGYVSFVVTEEDFSGDIEHEIRNNFGEQVGRSISIDKDELTIRDENYEEFIELSKAIHDSIKPKGKISQLTIEDCLFRWIVNLLQNDVEEDCVDYLFQEFSQLIIEHEIWIPIANLRIEEPFQVGKVTFHPISEELIGNWESAYLNGVQEDNHHFYKEFIHKRITKPLQGWTAISIKYIGDTNYSAEVAITETSKSLTLLRMFFPMALTPKSNCYVDIMGKEHIDSVIELSFKGDLLINYRKYNISSETKIMSIDNSFLSRIKLAGLEKMSLVLKENNTTKFEDDILGSIKLYSDATMNKDLSGKLVYLFAAIESILLKDSSEPIQQNIGERLATLIGKSLETKKEVIKNIKDIYQSRSAFIHHAQDVCDIENFEIFMKNIWLAMSIIMNNHDKHETKSEFITHIDDHKLMPKYSASNE